ncbi:MAG TPA: BatD family protein [Xanthomonadaceae bacterium]|nr:BatD family protein [Xanthomonadaceae bacterium]
MRLRLASVLAGLALFAAALDVGAQPRAWLDRDSIQLGETVTLNIEAGAGADEPDFSVLARDFELLGTSSRTQLSFSNGRRSASTLWAVALEPRREGTIAIPAFDLGGPGSTRPLTLAVRAALAPADADSGANVFLEIEAEPLEPYVQQQVRYTVRLHYAVTLLEGQLDEPAADGVELRRLGSDRSYRTTLAGRRYNVVERRYALIPERSGELTVPGPRFRGRALGARRSFSIDGDPVAARGESLVLNVRTAPDGAPSPWLPARELQLERTDPALPAEVSVGEPVTITVRLSAQGLGSSQLPEIELPPIEGAQVYPDLPSTRESEDQGWLTGVRERRFAIVPERAGELQLPAIEIAWWDVGSDRVARAAIAPAMIRVLPAAGSMPDPADTPASAPVPGSVQTSAGSNGPGVWPWLAAALAAAWALTLAWAWSVRRPRAGRAGTAPAAEPAPPAPSLEEALRSGEAARIVAALLAAAARQGRTVRNLGELAAAVADPAQARALQRFERARFGDGDGDRTAALADLRAAFRGRLRFQTPRTGHGAEALPPLYPDHTAR